MCIRKYLLKIVINILRKISQCELLNLVENFAGIRTCLNVATARKLKLEGYKNVINKYNGFPENILYHPFANFILKCSDWKARTGYTVSGSVRKVSRNVHHVHVEYKLSTCLAENRSSENFAVGKNFLTHSE